jgi:hypothetical protein
MVSMDCLGQKAWTNCKWSAGQTVGREFVRRRIAPRTTKAIATRATVRIAFADCVIDRTVSQTGGLSEDNMDVIATHFVDRTKAYQGQGVAKYIMLEIQREGEL